MQLKIFIKLDAPLSLPISYHHILQAVIYRLMGDDYGNALLHDGGESYGKRTYKLFVFSLLEGPYKIENKRITFFDDVSFEVRAFDENVIKTIEDNVLKNGIQFDNKKYDSVECSRRNTQIRDDKILIKMLSPVCVFKTLQDSKYTNYKKTIIEAYRGIFELSGRPEYLDFLYNTGIGSKNSQGFGMFKLYNAQNT